MKKNIGLYVPGWGNNQIFNVNHPANIDNWLMPFIKLKESLSHRGYNLETIDVANQPVCLLSFSKHYKENFENQFFFLTENEYIIKYDINFLNKKYKKIFTWDDRLVDGNRYIKYNYPQFYNKIKFNDFSNRSTLLTLISNNKFLNHNAKNDMYLERYKVIQYYEKKMGDFKLFGSGWNKPLRRNRLYSRLSEKILPNFCEVKLKNYQGVVKSKLITYADSKFSLCLENVSGIPGYITEKIFDSMFVGCVPVYCGASNVQQYIPNNCWIDYNRFDSPAELHYFLSNMSKSDYDEYHFNINSFLSNWQFNQFSTESFCDIVINEII